MGRIDLVVFLGNPGALYARNRHNAGRLLAERCDFLGSWRSAFKGLFCSVAGQRFDAGRTGNVYFLEPETFMNLSGESAREAAAFYKIPPENILVVHDELELAPGVVALKKGGGLGGHNGLRSLKSCLNSADFWRLRIGIGRPDDRAPGKGGGPEHHGPIDKWVLSNFTAEEADLFNTVFTECSTALFTALAKGPEALLPEWTKKRISIERNNYEQ